MILKRRYQLQELIGQGATVQVFSGKDIKYDTDVAIKKDITAMPSPPLANEAMIL